MELPPFVNLILGGFRGHQPGGCDDGERPNTILDVVMVVSVVGALILTAALWLFTRG
jgi:hypothetical protein